MLGYMITSLVPPDAHLLTLVEAATKYSSRKQSDSNIGQRRQRPSGMMALVVLDEIFLTVKDAVAAIHNTWPILSRLMHPHFMLFPIRLGLERLL